MDYKKKLKQRLSFGGIYIVLGIMMIVGVFVSGSDDDFISALGFAIAVVGAARIVQYLRISKNEDSIKKQEINETDERNLSIIQKARSAAFSVYLLVTCTAVIVTSLCNLHDMARLIGYSQLVLVIIYWICYWVYRIKL